MKKLNMQFRQKDKTTNVLSFPNDDISVKQTKNIGDIAISVEYVKAEAKKEGKTFDDHIIHMLAHGVYHILGYDHENNENAVIMENKEIQTSNNVAQSKPCAFSNRCSILPNSPPKRVFSTIFVGSCV